MSAPRSPKPPPSLYMALGLLIILAIATLLKGDGPSPDQDHFPKQIYGAEDDGK